MTATRHRTLAPAALVELLASPPRGSVADCVRLRALLCARLATTLPPRSAHLRLDAFVVEHGAVRFTTPFAWSVRGSRRALGTGVVRRLVADPRVAALDAAHEEVDRLCDRARRGLARRGALSTWLASSPPEVRALCALEAATWATRLVHLVEPGSNGGAVELGVPDAYVDVPATSLSLLGRRDATAVRTDGPGGVLRVRDGVPGERATDGLVVDALVASLAEGESVPRAVGAWPDAGIVLAVELDDEAARHGARLLVGAAAAIRARPESREATAVAA